MDYNNFSFSSVRFDVMDKLTLFASMGWALDRKPPARQGVAGGLVITWSHSIRG